jgi:hypothetical protein
MTVPTTISGAIIPRNINLSDALPKTGFTGPNVNFPFVSCALASELFTKTPAYTKIGGSTLSGMGSIYLNSSSHDTANRTVTFGFMPDFYLAAPSEINIGWGYIKNNINFSSAVPNITAGINDKFEAFYVDYSQIAFLTAAGGGATANAISGFTFGKAIFNGTESLTAKEIYYRYLGNTETQS